MKKTLTVLTLLFCIPILAHASLKEEYTKPVQRMRLSAEGSDPLCTWEKTGLSDAEQAVCWSCDETVSFSIVRDEKAVSVLFEDITANGSQKIYVVVDEYLQQTREYHFNQKSPQQSILVSLADFKSKGLVSVTFKIPGACQPGNGDPRKLGLAFRTISVFDVNEPRLQVSPAKPVFAYEQREFFAKGVRFASVLQAFPVEIVQKFKIALDELEPALKEYAVANKCELSDIWEDESNLLPRLQNAVTVLFASQDLVRQLESKWQEKGNTHVTPNLVGSMLWSMFVKKIELDRDDLKDGFRGNLAIRLKEVAKQVEAKSKQLSNQAQMSLIKASFEKELPIGLKLINIYELSQTLSDYDK
jgi:hypothetical protein